MPQTPTFDAPSTIHEHGDLRVREHFDRLAAEDNRGDTSTPVRSHYDQIAPSSFTLMMYKARANKKLILLRFNCPSQIEFEYRFKEDTEAISVLHYLRTDVVDRDMTESSASFPIVREAVASFPDRDHFHRAVSSLLGPGSRRATSRSSHRTIR
jgi:hypothetical protein